ncbi:TPA_asm: M [Coptis gammacytorhabdovirus 1]|nr:TPA_asm: M [Coptis gammacytorhabdovirus 1]
MASNIVSASAGLYPTSAEPLDSYTHAYLALNGSVQITGEHEAGLEEMYALLCSEASKRNWSQTVKDSVELLMWYADQNKSTSIQCKREFSKFFGPSSTVKIFIPKEQIFVLTKRTSFTEASSAVNLDFNGSWTISGVDWFLSVRLNGYVRKLSLHEIINFPSAQNHMYLKTDKYSPYYSMSSAMLIE